MKPQIALSPSQMHELESLGLDCSDASMCCINFNGTYAYIGGEEVENVKDCVNAHFYVEITPAYTLEDILLKLPPLIDGALLTIQKLDKRARLWQDEVTWGIAYMTCEYDSEDTLSTHSTGARKVILTNDLITGLVDMLKWVLKEHPDKIKRL